MSNKLKNIFSILAIFISVTNSMAQSNNKWNGKKCVVVLTYDDALSQHLDNAIPVLDSLGLKATFYLSAAFPGSTQRIADWRKAAKKGHELANHTLFHPCIGNTPGREWVGAEQNMNNYSVQRMVNEIKMTNAFLEAVDGKKKRTFAYPCADTKIHDTAYIDAVREEFVAVRNVRSEMLTIDKVDLSDVGCYMINGETGEQLIDLVKQAMQKHALIVFLFHGVEGGNSLNVSLAAHSKLLHFLKQQEKEIWTAPMIEVAEYINHYKSQLK